MCEYRDQCGSMVEEVRKALEYLQEMRERHEFVSEKTSALHQACEQLVQEQVQWILDSCKYQMMKGCFRGVRHLLMLI